MKKSKITSLEEAGFYIDSLKSRIAKDNAIRYFIKKFGWYL